MPSFDDYADNLVSAFCPEMQQAILDAPLPGLIDEPAVAEVAALIHRGQILQKPGSNGVPAKPTSAISASLWLLAGNLDRSHEFSQSDHSAEGSFWHGVMHRREGDYSNAKYWFAKVGGHPVFEQLASIQPGVYDDPAEFVDLVKSACSGKGDTGPLLRAQWTEWQLLTRHCLAKSGLIGTSGK